MAGKIGPEYQRLIDQIRSKITSGEYPVGRAIPSTAALAAAAGVSTQVVRRAVGQLEADGILEGHPGKGVFVRAMPEAADVERQDVAALGRQVSEMEERLREMAAHPDVSPDSDLGNVVADLQETVGRIEANLIDLYGKMGHEYPNSGSRNGGKKAARHGQAR